MFRLFWIVPAVVVMGVDIFIIPKTFAQSRGTFSASAVQGLGTGGSSPEQCGQYIFYNTVVHKLPKTTVTTIDKSLAMYARLVRKKLQAANKGTISAKTKSSIVWMPRSGRFQYRTWQDKKTMVKILNEKADNPTLPSLVPFRLQDKEIGCLSQKKYPWVQWRYYVTQIVNQKTALITVWDRNANTAFFLDSPVVRDLQEGQELIDIPGIVVVDGTRKYETVMGAVRTLPVLRDYDLKPHLAKLQK